MQAYKLNKEVQSEDRPLEIAYFFTPRRQSYAIGVVFCHSTFSANPSHLNFSSLLVGLPS